MATSESRTAVVLGDTDVKITVFWEVKPFNLVDIDVSKEPPTPILLLLWAV